MDEQRKDLDRFLTTGRAAKRLGVCGPTLRNWAEANAIDYVRTTRGAIDSMSTGISLK